MTTRTSKKTFVLGDWDPDHTAPVLDGQGVEAGRLLQAFGWYDIRFASGEVWAGGKAISKALATFAYVAKEHPEYCQRAA